MKPHDDPMRAAMDFVARVARRPEEYPERFVALPMDPDVIAAILSRERTRLLQFLAREGPTPSVEALAGALKRNYASVSRDVGVLEQAGEDFPAGGFADGEADALLGFVESVVEVQVGPAVGGSNRLIHFDVKITELLNVGGSLVGIVEAVIGLGQPLAPSAKQFLSMSVIPSTNVFQSSLLYI